MHTNDKTHQRFVYTILKVAYDATEQTKKLLTFSRKSEFTEEVVDLHTIIKDSMDLFKGGNKQNIVVKTVFEAQESHFPYHLHRLITQFLLMDVSTFKFMSCQLCSIFIYFEMT